MVIKLKAKKVMAFMAKMAALEAKFNNKYIDGNLNDYVKLDMIDNQLDLTFEKSVPEIVRIACYTVFIETLL